MKDKNETKTEELIKRSEDSVTNEMDKAIEDVIQQTIDRVFDTFDKAADAIESGSFNGSDRDAHVGIAGCILKSYHEADARDLNFAEADIRLSYFDKDSNSYVYKRTICNKTPLINKLVKG